MHFRVLDFEGKLCEQPGVVVRCVLLSCSTGAETACTVEEVSQSRYKVAYYPASFGKHQLHIKVNGIHIKESPFSVTVKPQAIEDVKLKGGNGVAIGLDGGLVVSEKAGHCVSLLDTSGIIWLIWQWGEAV